MHYDEKYFEYQQGDGAFGAKVDLFKFEKYIKPTDVVVDFGSGGGFFLKEIVCKERCGIEINDAARAFAKEINGIDSVKNSDEIPDSYADVIMSHHALEHVFRPLDEIEKLKRILKPVGKVIFVVPLEFRKPFDSNDMDMHIYTWSELNLGNLFKQAGYHVEEVTLIKHLWPPKYKTIYRLFGKRGFDLFARCYAVMRHKQYQVRVVATVE